MNIVSVLNKLKEAKMVSPTEDGLALFSDCFNKFGISILLLQDEEEFNKIVDILVENKIPLQKANGIYNLRVFAVPSNQLNEMIGQFQNLGEIELLRHFPEILAKPYDIQLILRNLEKAQQSGSIYKNGNDYDMDLLLEENEENVSLNDDEDVISYLKSIMHDPSLIDKVIHNISNDEEEDFNVALELQKVENKICEEYLFPVDDAWKIIIDQKEVNSFQDVKDTIDTIIKLNIPVTFHDALIFVLFYKSSLHVSEIKQILENRLFEGGVQE